MNMPIKFSLALLLAGSLSACVTQPTLLYQWEGYQPQVYAYFQAHELGVETQIIALEAGLQKMRSSGKTPPPGYHAHLGMLYSHVGKMDAVVQSFKTEIALYPESKAYMEFLLKKVGA